MGKIANKYRARAARITGETAKARGEAGRVMLQVAREATETQLYAQSPLPVSRRLFRSLRLWFKGQTVEVGYDLGKASYARRRLAMKGRSKTGGHRLDLDISGELRKEAFPRVRRIMGRCVQRIIK
jgi:hypothetical protein